MNFKETNFNEETLLAYVLGELGAEAKAQIELAAKSDAKLAERISALKKECEGFADTFKAEADADEEKLRAEGEEFAHALGALDKAQADAPKPSKFTKLFYFGASFSAAACLMLITLVSIRAARQADVEKLSGGAQTVMDVSASAPASEEKKGVSPDYAARRERIDALSKQGETQYLYGDYQSARTTFSEIETLDSDNAAVKGYQKLIVEKLKDGGRLTYETTRGQMLDEVARNWQRPDLPNASATAPKARTESPDSFSSPSAPTQESPLGVRHVKVGEDANSSSSSTAPAPKPAEAQRTETVDAGSLSFYQAPVEMGKRSSVKQASRISAQAQKTKELTWNRPIAYERASRGPMTETERKLNNIVIPEISFPEGVSLAHAINSLSILSAEYDKSDSPDGKKGINMMLVESDKSKSVTLTLRGLTLAQALAFITRQAGCVYEIENGCVVIREVKKEPEETEDDSADTDFTETLENPLSTFSIDVDTASYAAARRALLGSRACLPPQGSVREEEFINYFKYAYAGPEAGSKAPFATYTAFAKTPWDEERLLMRVAVKTRELEWRNRPASNLVFLVDVSGSMHSADKLDLAKASLKMLTAKLDGRDRVAVVTYASGVSLALPSTSADNFETIAHALDSLRASGGTNGAGGLELAYETAERAFIKDGINRVIICSDGDFNVGKSSVEDMKKLIKRKAQSGVFLSVAGFGSGNYRDDMMESLAHNGNGNYSYIDSVAEGRRVFSSAASGKLNCMAKDVKIQIEFNPEKVRAYRLIGYDNRRLSAADFNNDKKDAGDAGAGDAVTAIYEIIPASAEGSAKADVDRLKYSKLEVNKRHAGELCTLKIRWKEASAETSEKIERALKAPKETPALENADEDFRFAMSAALFAMKLKNSERAKGVSYADIIRLAKSALGDDASGERAEFISLVSTANKLSKRN